MSKQNPEIAVSSLAFLGKTAEQIIGIAEENGLIIEFSSGMPYRIDMESLYLSAPIKRIPHNYFPAPRDPFVLNLASDDPTIRTRSLAHCIDGLKLAKSSGAAFYSAHAGFCIDPHPSHLGNALDITSTIDRVLSWEIFVETVRAITKVALDLGVHFLIENNVIARFNLTKDGNNPLLCCDSFEMLKLIDEVQSPMLGLLLDTGHLKVSAQTLGFDPNTAVEQIRGSVMCIHHSDNNGLTDTNDSLSEGYWFLPHMVRFKNVMHVIEVKNIGVAQIALQKEILIKGASQT